MKHENGIDKLMNEVDDAKHELLVVMDSIHQFRALRSNLDTPTPHEDRKATTPPNEEVVDSGGMTSDDIDDLDPIKIMEQNFDSMFELIKMLHKKVIHLEEEITNLKSNR